MKKHFITKEHLQFYVLNPLLKFLLFAVVLLELYRTIILLDIVWLHSWTLPKNKTHIDSTLSVKDLIFLCYVVQSLIWVFEISH